MTRPPENALPYSVQAGPARPGTVRVIAVGGAGCNIAERLAWPRDAIRFVGLEETERELDIRLRTRLQDAREPAGPTRHLMCHIDFETPEEKMATFDARLRDHPYDEGQLHACSAGADAVVVVAGLGGKTGSYVAPLLLQLAQRLQIPAQALFSLPFDFENRTALAHAALRASRRYTNKVSVFRNDDLIAEFGDNITFEDLFESANTRMCATLQGMLAALER